MKYTLIQSWNTYVRLFFFSLYLILALSLSFDAQGDSTVRNAGDNPQSWWSAALLSPVMLDNESDMLEWTCAVGNPRLMFPAHAWFSGKQFVLPFKVRIMPVDPPTWEGLKATQSCWPDEDA